MPPTEEEQKMMKRMAAEAVELHAAKCQPMQQHLCDSLQATGEKLKEAVAALNSTNERIAGLSTQTAIFEGQMRDIRAAVFGMGEKGGLVRDMTRIDEAVKDVRVLLWTCFPMAVSGLVALAFMLGQMSERIKERSGENRQSIERIEKATKAEESTR